MDMALFILYLKKLETRNPSIIALEEHLPQYLGWLNTKIQLIWL